MPNCPICGEETNSFALVKIEMDSKGNTKLSCPKCHRDIADIWNYHLRLKDEAIRNFIKSKKECENNEAR